MGSSSPVPRPGPAAVPVPTPPHPPAFLPAISPSWNPVLEEGAPCPPAQTLLLSGAAGYSLAACPKSKETCRTVHLCPLCSGQCPLASGWGNLVTPHPRVSVARPSLKGPGITPAQGPRSEGQTPGTQSNRCGPQWLCEVNSGKLLSPGHLGDACSRPLPSFPL